jgi:DNA polymerase-3 subunit epsilon
VAHSPLFKQVAQEIMDFFGSADLSGYNLMRFDIPILMEEFARAGMRFSLEGRRVVDVQRIFYKMEPRTLSAAHRFYCGEEMEGAHDALADVKATVNVLKGQISAYQGVDYVDRDDNKVEEPVRNDVQQLHEFTNDLNVLDATQKLKRNGKGEVAFNFGKHNNKTVGEVLKIEPEYINWMIAKDFSVQVKEILKDEKKRFYA